MYTYIYSTYESGYLTADWISNTTRKITSILDGASYATFDSTVGMSDINGKSNTAIFAANDLDTDSAINCALQYAPEGTSASDWYVPAIGELSCIATYKTSINSKLTAINAVYPSDVFASLLDIGYWSSTSKSVKYCYYVNLSNGFIDSNDKDYYSLCVIAFLAI